MKKKLRFVTLLTLVQSCCFLMTRAQPRPTPIECGVRGISYEQAKDLSKEAQLAFQLKKASVTSLADGITYVPIRPHLVRRSDGTSNFSLERLNQIMAITNSHYLRKGMGIQFYFAGATPDYIDNDDWYYNYNAVQADNYDVTNALNQYYAGGAYGGGYAYYPANGLYSTRSFVGVSADNDYLGNHLIPHELGHNFNLYHTFGPNNGTAITNELVTRGSGTNCSTAADLVCDTPADPYGMAGAQLMTVNGCLQYDLNSTARDANGQAFVPSVINIMSYWPYTCTSDLTAGQQQRMQEGLALRLTHTAYTLDAPPTVMTAPTNLAGTISGATVVLTWQDNATNETGYFIERASGTSDDFVAIGGVGPDGNTFTDNRVTLGASYRYRIRPSNTTTGSLSPVVTLAITPPVVDGLSTTNITGASAQLNWSSLGTGVAHDVQWRPQGSNTWNTLTGLYGGTYYLNGLVANTPYEWRVKGSGGTVYSDAASFTTTCPAPQYPTSYASRGVASLYWSTATGQQYTLQWRQQGASAWLTADGITAGNYQLTGLTSATPYEWRVSATCPGAASVTTAYTPVQSFITVACPVPSLGVSGYTSTSLQFFWNVSFYEADRTYTLRYRPVGTATWITLTGLTGTTYSLTGLTTNVPYEAQVQSVCAPQEATAFSQVVTATPFCQQATYIYSTPAATTAKLEWNINGLPETGASMEIQYRPAGTTAWQTIPIPIFSRTTTYFSHLLTGLTNSTTYQWRVRVLCPGGTTDGNIATFSTNCFMPYSLFTSQVTSTDAKLGWYVGADPDARFDIQYRPVGTATWTTFSSQTALNSSYTGYTYSLTGLTNNTTYEWQVRTNCNGAPASSSYVTGYTFTTSCPVPYSLNIYPRLTSVQFSWYAAGPNMTYELRYRRNGTTDWTVISDITGTTYSATGLPPATNFEAQLKIRCSDGTYSAYSYSSTFYTSSCSQPQYLYTSSRSGTAAVLNWYISYSDPVTTFEVRYRVVNTPTWTTVSSSQTTTYSSYSLAVSNLTPDVQYEWQVRTICSATESSAFSSLYGFSTCATMYTLQSGQWTNPSIWSCGRIPVATDTVELRHDVSVPTSPTATTRKIIYAAGKQLIMSPAAKLILTP